MVTLNGSLAQANLQYGWIEYNLFSMNLSDTLLSIAADEKMRRRFEVNLEKPGNNEDCIIC